MKERNIVIIIVIILAILGLAAFYFSIVYSGFNFYKSEISINGKIIDEKLSYKPDKPYHTLYRNFQSPIFFIASGNLLAYGNSIGIKSVDCQQGQAYIRLSESYDSACYHFPVTNHAACLPYTEPNEYGCSFGNVYGFKKGQDYKVESQYELYPENLFKINNKYYIKFIVYSSGNHKLLIKGNNFILPSNIVSKKYYFPGDDVIIYAPYPPEGMNIVEQKNFEFDTNYFKKTLAVIVCLIPGMIFFFFWFFFGKENIEPDMPEELSMAPNKRKAWEVAAYFNPPFSGIDRNFFASLMLDLYKRKIIDLKMIEQKSILSTKKELFIKINKVSGGIR